MKRLAIAMNVIAIIGLAMLAHSCASDPDVRREMVILNAATVIDVEATMYAKKKSPNAVGEVNGLMAPLVDDGRVMVYAQLFALNAALGMIFDELKRQNFERWRWLPRVGAAGHLGAAAYTLTSKKKKDK